MRGEVVREWRKGERDRGRREGEKKGERLERLGEGGRKREEQPCSVHWIRVFLSSYTCVNTYI